MRACIALVALLSLLWGAASASGATLEEVGNFDRPIFVTSDPGDPDRLFVVEREGLVVEADQGGTTVFADLTSLVACCTSERGLLSIALAPDFAGSGRFYAAYTGTVAAGGEEGDVHVDSFLPDEEGGLVREPILAIGHSTNANHNGGQLQFGPDGYLYVSVGDGGGSGDPFDAGQDLGTLLGKLLRIDPRPDAEPPGYAIPPGNPFEGGGDGALDEIWAYGLRNPWRFSFDRESGDLIVADVGQSAREEVDHAPSPAAGTVGGAGANYGWDCHEGLLEYTGPPGGPSSNCPETGFVDPVFDYPHEEPEGDGAFGCSITGGYVVRDPSLGDLYGRYLYADFCQGQIRSLLLPAGGGPVTDDRSEGIAVANPTSFGEDSCGRIYVASNGGTVYRLVGDEPTACGEGPEPDPDPGPGPGPEPEPDPEPEPEMDPMPEPGRASSPTASPPPLVQPPPIVAVRPARIRVRAAGREARRGRLVRVAVRVTPCAGHAGRRVLLNRGGRRFRAKRLNRRCLARFRFRVTRRSTFRALVPASGGGTIRSRCLGACDRGGRRPPPA
jgi:hypothetical protein